MKNRQVNISSLDFGSVWVWGDNSGGVTLGINSNDEIITEPTEITSLSGIPISQLDFGIEFGAVLSSKFQKLCFIYFF